MLVTEPPGDPWALDNTRVLVVDDQAEIHDDFNEMLPSDPAPHASDQLATTFLQKPDAAHGLSLPRFDLLHASSGEEACAIVSKQHERGEPVAVAYVDIRMPPGIDGVQTVSRLRNIDCGIEVVVMTAYSDRPLPAIMGDRELLHKMLYIRKPFAHEGDPADHLVVAEEVARGARSRQQPPHAGRESPAARSGAQRHRQRRCHVRPRWATGLRQPIV